MHRQLPFQPVHRAWRSRLSPFWVRFWKPARRVLLRWQENVHDIEVRGLHHLQEVRSSNQGVLLTPNHFTYADPLILCEAAERTGSLLHFMAAGQIFATAGWLKRLILQQHGAFSLDREGDPLSGFRQAVEVLRRAQHPLVIFPEGEMFHFHDRVAPFQEGFARIALTAVRHRPVVCIPCALQYRCQHDPTPNLDSAVDRLESRILGRPSANVPLAGRVQGLVEALVRERECEHLGAEQSGPLGTRIERLSQLILERLEAMWGSSDPSASILERIKHLQQRYLAETSVGSVASHFANECVPRLDHTFQVMQLVCYPADYFLRDLDGERLVEVVDKLEEDILGVAIARPRALLKAIVTFAPPIMVKCDTDPQAAHRLTVLLEQSVQNLLGSSRYSYRNSMEDAFRSSIALAAASPP